MMYFITIKIGTTKEVLLIDEKTNITVNTALANDENLFFYSLNPKNLEDRRLQYRKFSSINSVEFREAKSVGVPEPEY